MDIVDISNVIESLDLILCNTIDDLITHDYTKGILAQAIIASEMLHNLSILLHQEYGF